MEHLIQTLNPATPRGPACFRDKLPGYTTVLGFTAGQVTAIVGDTNWLIYVLGSWLAAVRT